jgi:hydroxyacylglutathione hydrolase
MLVSGWSNVYLITSGGHHILADTGPSLMSELLLRRISDYGIIRPDALVLTHTHFDHTGSAAVLKEKYHMPVIVHRSEAEYLESGLSPLPRGSIAFTAFLYRLGAKRVENRFRVKPVVPDILLDDSMELGSFGIAASIIHTPGHSRGSCSIIVDGQIAITGDTCVSPFRGKAFPPWADDTAALLKSWKVLLDTGCELFLPMHHHMITRKTLEREYVKRAG